MKRRLALVAVLAVASLGLLASSSSADSYRKCIPNKEAGVWVHNHVTFLLFCGSAKVTYHSAGKTTHYDGGACYKIVGSFIVGVGKFTTLGHTPVYSAFYLVSPLPQDGSTKLGVLTLQRKGLRLAANKLSMKVTGGRSRGTFSGKFPKGAAFSGSFTCK